MLFHLWFQASYSSQLGVLSIGPDLLLNTFWQPVTSFEFCASRRPRSVILIIRKIKVFAIMTEAPGYNQKQLDAQASCQASLGFDNVYKAKSMLECVSVRSLGRTQAPN